MTKFILIFLFCANAFSASTSFVVESLGVTEFERMFVMNGPHRFDRVILDCQSFLHGINFYDQKTNRRPEWELSFSFYIDSHDCQKIYEHLNQKKTCVTLFSNQSYSLSDDLKNCP